MLVSLLLLSLHILTRSIYNVPSYYGHFSKNFFSLSKLRSGRFRYFEYHYAVDLDSSNRTVYYVNQAQHCIEKYDLLVGTKSVLAGKCGVAGDRVGGLDVMLLNKPSSVVYFQPNEQARLSELAMGMLIVANSSCDVQQPGCVIYPTNSNGLNMSNLRLWPPILQFPPTSPNQPEYLFISDTENHCIKKLNLQLKTSTVVAGECGTSGFMDGPTGFNKLNRPTSLGISRSGVLYFYDEGNEYMRKLETNN